MPDYGNALDPARWLQDAAMRWPNARGVIDGERALTFRDANRLASEYAARLSSSGVVAGDRVLLQLPNGADLFCLIHAAWRLGAVPVPVVALYRERELGSVVADCRPSAIVGIGERGDRRPAEELQTALDGADIGDVACFCLGQGPHGWAKLSPADYTEVDSAEPARVGDVVLTLYSSGTTSEPKGVLHAAGPLLETARTYHRAALLTGDDVVLVPAPMAHVGAFVSGAVLPCLLGTTAVLVPRWDVARVADLIATERVTFAAGATVMLEDLVAHYEKAGCSAGPLAAFQTGAAAVPAQLVCRAQALGISAWRAWGMTECPNAAVGGLGVPLERRATTDGRIEPGVEVTVVAADGTRCAPGVEGELWVRGAKLMLGYSKQHLTDAQLDDEGWFHTGDLGVVWDGWVTVTGRIKDLINRGGEKFSAREIEEVLLNHPAVGDAAVIGVPDPRFGETVVAFLVPRPGATYPGDEEMVDHLIRARLARQKIPVAWRIVPALPYTATGKVEKRELLATWPLEEVSITRHQLATNFPRPSVPDKPTARVTERSPSKEQR